nr:ribonuclease H-like domain-containing protein [Tanacetum cinerariifolium]
MSSMRDLTFFLGLQVIQRDDGIFFSQDKYVADILKKFDFSLKLTESEGFEQIIDFLNASYVKYALTINPTVYNSCIEQFWAIAKVKNVNGEAQLQVLVDKKKVIITKASIRRDLRFEDEGRVDCLSNEVIFEQLILMGSTMAFAIICLAINEKFNFSKYIFDNMVLDLEEAKTAQAKEIAGLKKKVKKLEQKRKSRTLGIKVLRKAGSARRVESLTKASLGDQEVASKQRRMIDNIDQDIEITLVDDTQGRINKEDMFRIHDLDGDEVVVDVSTSENVEQSVKVIEKEVSTADLVTTAGYYNYCYNSYSVGTRPKEKGIVMQEPSKTPSPKLIISSQKPSQDKDKGKGKMVEPKNPLKRKDQIMIDEEVAKNLEAQMQAELEEEERLARLKMLFNNTMKWIKAFVPMDTELVKGSDKAIKGSEKDKEVSSKRAASNLEQRDARQRLKKENESVELKRCLEIIPEDDDDVTIEATSLSSKSSTIVDYKIYKEGKKNYFKIIKADGNSQNLAFRKMFKNFNREDLEVL